MGRVTKLGPWSGTYTPGYDLTFWKQGDPRHKVRDVDLRSAVAIQTSKSLQDIAGTFTITLKDARAKHAIQEMDVVRIRLRGHQAPLTTCFRGVVDEVRQAGSADVYAAEEDTVITGRCMAKYLQVNSLFLPVWNPQALLPTALIFGAGDAAQKVGVGVNRNTPREIFGYLLRKFVYGTRGSVGISGTPNARFWVNGSKRFEVVKDSSGQPFRIPFIQFDEDEVDAALKRLEILGFTETWVDEIGYVVYRQPQWDAPVSYQLNTTGLSNWSFPRSDVGAATYVEVVPAGDPGIGTATAQALRAGRAPVPSSYLSSSSASVQNDTGLGAYTDSEFIIDTDAQGNVTRAGSKNAWYLLQRRLGVRPMQITSPLIFTQEQAQQQAQGLLRFFSRMVKTGTITIPGEPHVWLGTTLQAFGDLRGQHINRTYYIEGVQHDYVDGSHYTTSLTLTHGRDPWDPKWGHMVLPKYTPEAVTTQPGVIGPAGYPQAPTTPGDQATINADGTASAPANAPNAVRQIISAGNRLIGLPYVYGGGHGTSLDKVDSGYDCSSSVSFALHGAGLVSSPMVSGDFESWGEPGPGRWVTIYAASDHVFMYVAGIRFDTSPRAGDGGPAATLHGPRWRTWPRDTSRFTAVHPKGL